MTDLDKFDFPVGNLIELVVEKPPVIPLEKIFVISEVNNTPGNYNTYLK